VLDTVLEPLNAETSLQSLNSLETPSLPLTQIDVKVGTLCKEIPRNSHLADQLKPVATSEVVGSVSGWKGGDENWLASI